MDSFPSHKNTNAPHLSADYGYEVPLLNNFGHNDPSNLQSTHTYQFASVLPSTPILRARVAAYNVNNEQLAAQSAKLKARSGELETRYRRVISLCTGVEENRVEEMLPALVAAVESENSDGMEVARVREFLKKVEGV